MEFVYIWLSKQNISPANFFSSVVTFRFSDMMFWNGELRFESPFNRSRRSSDLPITGVLNVERFLGTVGITFFCYITLLLFLIPLSLSLNHAYPFTRQNTRTLHTHTHTYTYKAFLPKANWVNERERGLLYLTLSYSRSYYTFFLCWSRVQSCPVIVFFLHSYVRSTVAQWWSIVKIYFSFASFPWWSLF